MRTFRQRFEKIVDDHPFTLLSLLVLSLGGAPLLLYSVSIGQLPDFTLTDLTGALIAAFVIEIGLAGLFAIYFLFAGFSARFVLDQFYEDNPTASIGQSGSPTQNQQMRDRLLRGRFILLATMLTGLLWGEALASPFVYWIGPALAWLTVVGYLMTYAGLIGLLIDNESIATSGRTRVLWSVFAFGAVVLVALQLAARLKPIMVDPALADQAHPLAFACSKLAPVARIGIEWITAHLWIPSVLVVVSVALLVRRRWTGRSASVSNRALRVGLRWVLGIAIAAFVLASSSWMVDHARFEWLWQANWLALSVVGAATGVVGLLWLIWRVLRGRLANTSIVGGGGPRLLARWNGPSKLIVAKLCVTVVFAFCTVWVLLSAYFLVDMTHAKDRAQILFMTISLLSVFNWAAFSTRGWKTRAGLCVMVAIAAFASVPTIAQNPLLFPRMLVTTLGFGNRHALSMALSGQQCATLAPFGVRCSTGKDGSITLTHVNIVNRLGSSMVIELMLRTDSSADTGPVIARKSATVAQPRAVHVPETGSRRAAKPVPAAASRPSSAVSANVSAQTLVLTMAVRDSISHEQGHGCDPFLLELRTRALKRAPVQAEKSSDKTKASGGGAASGTKAVGAVSVMAPTAPLVKDADLSCVRITIPKDQVVSYASAGGRSYEAGYSGYIPAAEKMDGVH
ncbi:hypothetical protein [Burkholderia anthina]|uniref:ABC transporter permease n=1 Tax=Burkholderia anthina TaxID=179879 RepID=A0AAW3PNM4_9BURK|nr:hypothetical protein [Burkholderia anthina]KWZ29710.1 hypothetical protein WS64_29960 [Burkholderia anthina]